MYERYLLPCCHCPSSSGMTWTGSTSQSSLDECRSRVKKVGFREIWLSNGLQLPAELNKDETVAWEEQIEDRNNTAKSILLLFALFATVYWAKRIRHSCMCPCVCVCMHSPGKYMTRLFLIIFIDHPYTWEAANSEPVCRCCKLVGWWYNPPLWTKKASNRYSSATHSTRFVNEHDWKQNSSQSDCRDRRTLDVWIGLFEILFEKQLTFFLVSNGLHCTVIWSVSWFVRRQIW